MQLDGHICTYSKICLYFNFFIHSKAFLSVSRAFMQFAVILRECFKCHARYSAAIKVGWMANTFSSKGNVFLWFTWNHRHWSYACTENTHIVNKITAHTLHWIQHCCTDVSVYVLDVIRILDFLTITGSVTVNEKKFQTEKSPHQAGKPKQRNVQPELKKEHYNTENSWGYLN